MTLNIQDYKLDGFEKVCDIKLQGNNFYYENINQPLMYADHKSWVYLIVDDNEVVKVGETGQPLGIRRKNEQWWETDPQPLTGSKSRFGRYINGDDTDRYCRESLQESIYSNTVAFWAKKCDYVETPYTFCGAPAGTVISTFHKDLEKKYLDNIVKKTGALPRLNKGRA